MSTEHLLVPLDLPPAPHVLASTGFLSTLNQVEEQIAALKVTDAPSAQLAASLQVRLTQAGTELEKTRVQLTAPYLAAQRKIADVARGPLDRITVAKNALKFALTNYDAEQRRKAAEAEKVRQAELARLEALRQEEIRKEQAEQADAQRIADAALINAAPVNLEDILDLTEEAPTPPPKTEVQRALEVAQHAPAVVVQRPTGVTFKTTLVASVFDVNLLPESFIEKTPKLRAIQATFCTGWVEGRAIPVCPGVRFEVKREPVSSGRSGF